MAAPFVSSLPATVSSNAINSGGNSPSSSYTSDDSFLHRTNSALDDDNDRLARDDDDDNLASNFYAVPHNLTSFLDHRPLAWRSLPLAHPGGADTKDPSLYTHTSSRTHTRGRRDDSLERLRYDMADFVKATVWANHDTVRLRPSECAKHAGEVVSKGIFVDCGLELPAWLLATRGEHLHIHADGSAHMILSLADAAAAVECGWAERLPVTLEDDLNTPTIHYVSVHAPRCAAELPDWKRLVLASVRFCTYTQRELCIRRPERL